MTRLSILCILLAVNAFSVTAFAAQKTVPRKAGARAPTPIAAPVPIAERESGDIATSGATQPKLMDGVELEAVETYINPTQNQLGLGIGIYPFDAYFYGMSINAGYTYHETRTLAWEVINVAYFFTFQKDLTTELADRYAVDPRTIATLNYVISSDVQYVFAYGKMAMMEEYIRYFRLSAAGGAGVVKTSDQTAVALQTGLKFEAFTKDSFSWTFEVRDSLAIPGFHNYMTFTLGTGISF